MLWTRFLIINSGMQGQPLKASLDLEQRRPGSHLNDGVDPADGGTLRSVVRVSELRCVGHLKY